MGVRWDHALDGGKRAPVSGDGDLQATVDRLTRSVGLERHLIHVDEVLAQRLKVDFGPVGLGISLQNADNLLDRAECVLAGHCRRGQVALGVLLATRLHHLLVVLHHVRHLIVTWHTVGHRRRLLGNHGPDGVDKSQG